MNLLERFGGSNINWGISESPLVLEDRVLVNAGGRNGSIVALDKKDGSTLWTFETQGEIKASPVVVGDTVLMSSYDQHLYALDRKSGTLLWKFQSQGPLHSTPGISDGLAYVTGCDAVLRGIRIGDGVEALDHVGCLAQRIAGDRW